MSKGDICQALLQVHMMLTGINKDTCPPGGFVHQEFYKVSSMNA